MNDSLTRWMVVLGGVVLGGCAEGPAVEIDAGANADAWLATSDVGMLDDVSSDGAPSDDGGAETLLDARMSSASPASIEIYSGNGLVMPQGYPSGEPLRVIVLDAAGQPVRDAEVTWIVAEGGVALTGPFPTGPVGVSLTGPDGVAEAGLRGEFGSMSTSALTATIEARCDAGSVWLTAFSTYSAPGAVPSLPSMLVATPEIRDFGTLAPGAMVPGGLVVNVAHQNGDDRGRPMAGVGVRFLPPDEATSHTPSIVSCANATEALRAGGTVFTDASGRAVCDVRAPTVPGTYNVGVRVGGAVDFFPFALTVR